MATLKKPKQFKVPPQLRSRIGRATTTKNLLERLKAEQKKRKKKNKKAE